MKLKSYFLQILVAGVCAGSVASCDDMLDMGSDYVVYADENHLTTPADTVNSVLGILNKLQGIAVRTHLLGELRGDLVKVNDVALADLKDLADFNISDENVYNRPRDYYAVINNCNYYLAYADTALMNNRNEKIFEREYAAVRSIRAWTYLQLVLNYGRVPLVTVPVLTEIDSKKDYPMTDLEGICDYFINDLLPYQNISFPNYQKIDDRINPFLCFFPVSVVLGDLSLWKGAVSQNPAYSRQAAQYYYNWIRSDRDKVPTRTSQWRREWPVSSLESGNYYGTISWTSGVGGEPFSSSAITSYGGYGAEVVTVIAMDSAANDGYYNQLRSLYNTISDNDYKASLSPSARMFEISEAQAYCGETSSGTLVYPAKSDIDEEYMSNAAGDLRLSSRLTTGTARINGVSVDMQRIDKTNLQDIYIYRVGTVYLRLAEALNHAGFPRFAYDILSKGLSNSVIAKDVLPYCGNHQDSLWVQALDFPNAYFSTVEDQASGYTMIGLHSRGSGNTIKNERYFVSAYTDSTDYPKDPESLTFKADSAAWAEAAKARDIVLVDSLIDNEQVLETSFEGCRFYDLMRMALRKGSPEWLADKVSRRNGAASVDAQLKALLSDKKNWYMSWKGQIGYK